MPHCSQGSQFKVGSQIDFSYWNNSKIVTKIYQYEQNNNFQDRYIIREQIDFGEELHISNQSYNHDLRAKRNNLEVPIKIRRNLSLSLNPTPRIKSGPH